jgi:hypothetical protein
VDGGYQLSGVIEAGDAAATIRNFRTVRRAPPRWLQTSVEYLGLALMAAFALIHIYGRVGFAIDKNAAFELPTVSARKA